MGDVLSVEFNFHKSESIAFDRSNANMGYFFENVLIFLNFYAKIYLPN